MLNGGTSSRARLIANLNTFSKICVFLLSSASAFFVFQSPVHGPPFTLLSSYSTACCTQSIRSPNHCSPVIRVCIAEPRSGSLRFVQHGAMHTTLVLTPARPRTRCEPTNEIRRASYCSDIFDVYTGIPSEQVCKGTTLLWGSFSTPLLRRFPHTASPSEQHNIRPRTHTPVPRTVRPHSQTKHACVEKAASEAYKPPLKDTSKSPAHITQNPSYSSALPALFKLRTG